MTSFTIFILADNPIFFTRNVGNYRSFMTDFAQTAENPKNFIAWLAEHRWEYVAVLQGLTQHIQDSSLASRDWSQVPLAFGAESGDVCRYAVAPHPDNLFAPSSNDQEEENYLRKVLIEHLAHREAQFIFTVQLIARTTERVVNNPKVIWDEPEQVVATLVIPPQAADGARMMAPGEGLSFTPWHGLSDHRPVGEINKIRRRVYAASSALRRADPPDQRYRRRVFLNRPTPRASLPRLWPDRPCDGDRRHPPQQSFQRQPTRSTARLILAQLRYGQRSRASPMPWSDLDFPMLRKAPVPEHLG